MIHYQDDAVTVHHGDCIEVLRTLPDASVHSVVTDPPYGLRFMGQAWDGADIEAHTKHRRSQAPMPDGKGGPNGGYQSASTEAGRYDFTANQAFQQWCEQWVAECLRVLKPGGYMIAFGGSRTWHRLAAAVEDAGFEIRDSIAWLYGSGFPKSLDVSKAIDRAAGVEREVVGERKGGAALNIGGDNPRPWHERQAERGGIYDVTAPATAAAKAWEGWGTALKPAFEPIVVGRKPLDGTVAANVQAHGTGAMNIDATRIGAEQRTNRGMSSLGVMHDDNWVPREVESTVFGRFPANVLLDESQAEALDALPGQPSRFFPTFRYEAKAPTTERPSVDGVQHPTVKPLDLMRWLCRLVTTPGGIVLDPFAGSGTTAEAAIIEGFSCITIEREESYLPLITHRVTKDTQHAFNLGADL